MSHPSTLYRFRLDVSDVDRGFYEALDFRVALHPSETLPYLITRVLAFALNAGGDSHLPLEFNAGGLSDADEPCLKRISNQGGVDLWIEIGNPSARKLHKAAKAAKTVKVYTHKDPEALRREVAADGRVHRADQIDVHAISTSFLEDLSRLLERDNRWSVMHQEGQLTIGIGETMRQTEMRHLKFES